MLFWPSLLGEMTLWWRLLFSAYAAVQCDPRCTKIPGQGTCLSDGQCLCWWGWTGPNGTYITSGVLKNRIVVSLLDSSVYNFRRIWYKYGGVKQNIVRWENQSRMKRIHNALLCLTLIWWCHLSVIVHFSWIEDSLCWSFPLCRNIYLDFSVFTNRPTTAQGHVTTHMTTSTHHVRTFPPLQLVVCLLQMSLLQFPVILSVVQVSRACFTELCCLPLFPNYCMLPSPLRCIPWAVSQ